MESEKDTKESGVGEMSKTEVGDAVVESNWEEVNSG
jgi:hypothetical protein